MTKIIVPILDENSLEELATLQTAGYPIDDEVAEQLEFQIIHA